MNDEDRVEDLNEMLSLVQIRDLTKASPEQRFNVLQSLVVALDSGMTIIKDHVVDKKPEPFPGAVKAVIAQQFAIIELARKGGLLP